MDRGVRALPAGRRLRRRYRFGVVDVNRLVTRCADWYCRIFGTPTAFALSVVALAVWTAFIPILGWAHWNSGPGLFGNTFESTGEWFFGLGTLLVAGAVSRKQWEHEEKLDESLAHVEQVASQMSEVLLRVDRMETQHGSVLAEILDAVHFPPPCPLPHAPHAATEG